MDWPDLRAMADTTIAGSVIGEPISYHRAGGPTFIARGVFDLEGYEADLATGLRVATGHPKIGIRDDEIGGPAFAGDTVYVRDRLYTVMSVYPGERGWSRCDLNEA